jgi:putative ABC transport system permease protein
MVTIQALWTFLADLRYGWRQLRDRPGFTVVAVLTLALGIGATTAIFSVVNPILLEPLPYPQSKRIAMVWGRYQGARAEVSYGTYRELAERNRSFVSLAIFEPWLPAVTGGSQAERLQGQSVSANFFRVLGVAPALGRDLEENDTVFNGPKTVILSDRLWRQRFNADRGILGRQIKLDDDNYTVIAVMPAKFENVLAPSAEIWTGEQYDPRQLWTNFNSWEWGNHLHSVGRLRPGVTMAQAAQELADIARTPLPQFRRPLWAALRGGLIVDRLQDDVARTVKPVLLALFGAVVLVLAIACVNVVNLLLARSAQRRGEFATRLALGASRARVVRQLVTESLLLSLVGGTAGVGVAVFGVRALIALSPPGLPRLDAIVVDRVAFAFALGITVLIGIASGLVPALYVSRREVYASLQLNSRNTAGRHAWMRRVLVVTEVALALVLLVGAGLLSHSMMRLLSVDPGINPSHLLTLQVQTTGHQFDHLASAPGAGSARRRRFFEQALDAVRRVPGVQQAAFTSFLPLSDDPQVVGVFGATFEKDGPASAYGVFRYAVSPGYWQTMGIPLRSGRYLDEHDTAGAPHVALLSESLTRREFGAENPIGKRLHVGPTDQPWFTVVGVVADVKQTSLAIGEAEAVYLSTEQTWFADDTLSFVVRAQGNAAELAPEVRQAIWSVDNGQPIVRVVTMEKLVAQSAAERRFTLIIFAAFAAVALVLAAIGIYGVLAGSVTERVREIGVRLALGASPQDVLALVLRQGLRLTMIGTACGLVGAVVASRALAAMLFGVSRLDPATYVGVIALLVGVSAVACAVPAVRASRVDPAITLRAE